MKDPGWLGAAVALVFVGVAVLVAHRHRLGMAREIVLAAARAFLQLAAIGYILVLIFENAGLPGALGWVAGMVVVAGGVSARRARPLTGTRAVATLAVAVGTAPMLGLLLALRLVEAVPSTVVPIGGMIVAGAMQATTLALRSIAADARVHRAAVEARLALGDSPTRAFDPYSRDALRTALIPAVDATKIVGLISLPGTMTGLILAGSSPLVAVRYQIVIMFILLATTAVAAAVVQRFATRLLFDDAERLVVL